MSFFLEAWAGELLLLITKYRASRYKSGQSGSGLNDISPFESRQVTSIILQKRVLKTR